ncbi:putative zinc metalloprotease [Candidatus Clavichlamydia salmonicola]|uniref:site-2 protease family protein n=1 Tax=Candidatus Clavichlamydia salmonicola TaxID=469812 RepID=UPI00189162FC|nr:site-2 protease family protein [Candidatus Clavichlamydia salmonicola]MBF5051041.1 putative zinc metalloprotease [Candidatus Clavichlamydia salmonicola]
MTLLYLIPAAFGLGVLILVHELGHYWVARKVGMTVEIFSIGFGPVLFRKKIKGVEWRISIIPFGGYVKIFGMDWSDLSEKNSINNQEGPLGFFQFAAWKRILVLLAGPVANLILAFIFFSAIWGMGGRTKFFSEVTRVVGWVAPDSEAYEAGLRSGDIITHCNDVPYSSIREVMAASLIGKNNLKLNGLRIDYGTQKLMPLALSFSKSKNNSPTNFKAFLGGARYLTYDKFANGQLNPLPEGSPLQDSGLNYGDRLIWMDGELLFSTEQMSRIVNEAEALLTIQRGDRIFLSRQPRIVAGELMLPSSLKSELIDRQYEACLKGRWADLHVIPYVINIEGVVEKRLEHFLFEEDSLMQGSGVYVEADLLMPLQQGDRIIAVDGNEVRSGAEVLALLQKHKVTAVVAKHNSKNIQERLTPKQEEQAFLQSMSFSQQGILDSLIKGTPLPNSSLRFLNSFYPKRVDQFLLSPETRQKISLELDKQKERIEAMRNKSKRAFLLKRLEENKQRVLVGVHLQDEKVTYNPTPFTLFNDATHETVSTFKALFSGSLNPAWLSGPVGVVKVLYHGWMLGLKEAFFWLGLISVNLGILNLLPLPVLDGGYILLFVIELLTGKSPSKRFFQKVIGFFTLLLIVAFLFLTLQDVLRLF